MPLCGWEHAGGFPIYLAEMAIGGPCDEAMFLVGLLHAVQEIAEGLWSKGDVFPAGVRCEGGAENDHDSRGDFDVEAVNVLQCQSDHSVGADQKPCPGTLGATSGSRGPTARKQTKICFH